MFYENLDCWKTAVGLILLLFVPMCTLNTIIILKNVKKGVLKE